MPGWSKAKRERVEAAFYVFLSNCYVNSKDHGRICLGEHLFTGQKMFVSAVFDGLEQDKHDIFILKSRQLGISTISRALTAFYLGAHPGLRSALVFDTVPHKEEARAELVQMLHDLPPSLGFPAISGSGKGNRDNMALENDSRIQFMSAGVKKSKSSGTLGRSSGLTMAHSSELCSWDNDEGLKSFKQALSEVHPDRLYIWESTARGFNQWYNMWKDAREDEAHCICLFLGWWTKDSQRIDRDHPDFQLYGMTPPTEKEAKKIREVKKLYNFDISMEQLAWLRRKLDPTAKSLGDAEPEWDSDDTVMLAEQASTEEEAFQQTGAIFFGAEQLTEMSRKTVQRKYQTYQFIAGTEFIDMKVVRAVNAKSVELKIFEEPDPNGYYVLGIDPAFGENELNDRSSIQVLRGYADGVDQVAEFASPLINTRQFARVIAALLGYYGADNATVKYALELNGPGMAVYNEIRSLKNQIDVGYRASDYEAKGLRAIFRNVRTYIYTRPDSMGAGCNVHLKTNQQLKILFMERLRDFVSNGQFIVRSEALVEEMKTIARDGDSISAPSGMKDDRVLAAAFAIHCWESGPRKQLLTERRTREAEEARKRKSIVDQSKLLNQNMLSAFFDQRKKTRLLATQQAQKQRWRYGR